MALSSRGGLLAVQHFSSANRRPLVPHLPGGRGLGLHALGESRRRVRGRRHPARSNRKQFSWINPKPLWESRNDKIARWLGDSTHHERMRWVEAQRRKGVDHLPIRTYEDKEKVAFMVLGDPGEGDDSQYQVLRPLRATSSDTNFTFIVSDVSTRPGTGTSTAPSSTGPTSGFPAPSTPFPGTTTGTTG